MTDRNIGVTYMTVFCFVSMFLPFLIFLLFSPFMPTDEQLMFFQTS